MNNDELKQLEQDLAAAFPEWFNFVWRDSGQRYFQCNRADHWQQVSTCAFWGLDTLLGACLDAAASRGWLVDTNKFPRCNTLVSIAQELNVDGFAEWQEIAQGTHETPAIAAALAILEAHRCEVGV